MPLQHEGAALPLWAIVIEPPGNIARELGSRRRMEIASGRLRASIAFPDVALAAWGRGSRRPAPGGRSTGGYPRMLGRCWEGVLGPFHAADIVSRGGVVYLGLGDPFARLCLNAAAALDGLGLATTGESPLAPGIGFPLGAYAEGAPEAPDSSSLDPSPAISFAACSLALLRFDFGPDALDAASWRPVARSRRHVGP